MKREKITQEESKLAMKAQSPIDENRQGWSAEQKNRGLERISTFKQLAKVSRNSKLTFGGTSQWVQPERLFNESYQQGLESVPFYVTKAFQYTSKQGYGERLGLEIVLSDGKMLLTALGLHEGDIKRNNMVSMFKDPGAPPIGPFILTKLPTNKGNDYYDLVPYQGNQPQTDEISFVNIDEDIPF